MTRDATDKPKMRIGELLVEAGVLSEDQLSDALRQQKRSGKMLGELFPEKFGTSLVFITHYPLELRPAYTMPSMTDKGMTESFDLTYKGMEITTGGQRIHLHDLLVERFRAKGFNPDHFRFYLDPFRYGAPPHGGLGLGVERLTMQLLGLENIREAALLPRDRDRLTP